MTVPLRAAPRRPPPLHPRGLDAVGAAGVRRFALWIAGLLPTLFSAGTVRSEPVRSTVAPPKVTARGGPLKDESEAK